MGDLYMYIPVLRTAAANAAQSWEPPKLHPNGHSRRKRLIRKAAPAGYGGPSIYEMTHDLYGLLCNALDIELAANRQGPLSEIWVITGVFQSLPKDLEELIERYIRQEYFTYRLIRLLPLTSYATWENARGRTSEDVVEMLTGIADELERVAYSHG